MCHKNHTVSRIVELMTLMKLLIFILRLNYRGLDIRISYFIKGYVTQVPILPILPIRKKFDIGMKNQIMATRRFDKLSTTLSRIFFR